MIVRRNILRIQLDQFCEFLDRLGVVSSRGVSHRQTVSRKNVAWVLFDQVLQNFETILRHPCATIPRWRARISSRRNDGAMCGRLSRLAIFGGVSATPTPACPSSLMNAC